MRSAVISGIVHPAGGVESAHHIRERVMTSHETSIEFAVVVIEAYLFLTVEGCVPNPSVGPDVESAGKAVDQGFDSFGCGFSAGVAERFFIA